MNEINLSGNIYKIEYSHNINDVEYSKALIYAVTDKDESSIPIKFRTKDLHDIKEDDKISIKGNVRSYSQKLANSKHSVNIYVFTYFDKIDGTNTNWFEIDGRICKTDKLRFVDNKLKYQCILANNIISSTSKQKINNYLPLVFYDKLAKEASNLAISDIIKVKGYLRSREYSKVNPDNTLTFKTAYELVCEELEVEH